MVACLAGSRVVDHRSIPAGGSTLEIARSLRRSAAAVAAAGLILAVGSRPSASPGAPAAGLAPAPSARVGVASCANRGCHGAVGPVEPTSGDAYIAGGAYTTWRAFDPHARAFATLLGPRSVAIAARLRSSTPAQDSRLCLACHSTPTEADDPAPAPRAVDCEGCHGPAGKWSEAHVVLDWMKLDPASKAASGYRDLAGPRARAEACVSCHVGDRSRGMEVGHDLIAAGHPRLRFEYASHLAALPRHWREEGETATSGAKSWAVGQAVAARASLRLLAARAEGDGPWPEFSESECFACHHVPAAAGPIRDPGAIGSPRWAAWSSAMLPLVAADRPDVAAAWAGVRAEMERPEPDAPAVAAKAHAGLEALDAWIRAMDASNFDAARVEAWQIRLTRPGPTVAESWDEAAQRFLALEAFARASGRSGPDPASLAFPPGYDSPRQGRDATLP